MAASLIDTMTEDFDPSAYKDTYREALEALVQAKIEGNEVVRPAGGIAAEKPSGPADLTETLRASVEAAKANRSGGKAQDGAGKRSSAKSGDGAKSGGGAKSGDSRSGSGARSGGTGKSAAKSKAGAAARKKASA